VMSVTLCQLSLSSSKLMSTPVSPVYVTGVTGHRCVTGVTGVVCHANIIAVVVVVIVIVTVLYLLVY